MKLILIITSLVYMTHGLDCDLLKSTLHDRFIWFKAEFRPEIKAIGYGLSPKSDPCGLCLPPREEKRKCLRAGVCNYLNTVLDPFNVTRVVNPTPFYSEIYQYGMWHLTFYGDEKCNKDFEDWYKHP